MNLQPLWWCPIQVTILAVAAGCIDALIGRRRPAARAVVAVSTLAAVVAISATTFCPFPSWGNWGSAQERAKDAAWLGPASGAPKNLTARFDSIRPSSGPLNRSTIRTRRADDSVLATINDHRALFLAAFYLVGLGGMALRIRLGLTAARNYRRDSRPIVDRRLSEMADSIRAQLGCSRAIELRESTILGTAATIGWRQPIILLPSEWPTWTEVERRAAIAHEIEHVRRQDFPCWVIAQVGLALHFYHPLVHLLVARLRLQQELAADAAAARVVGGQHTYLMTLAAMALRRSDAPVAWPARAFLPRSSTFLRRIDMLHRSQSMRSDVSRPAVCASIAAVAMAALCAAGFRASAAAQPPGAAGLRLVAISQLDKPTPETKESRAKSVENLTRLRQLTLAVINHYSNARIPPSAIIGPDGTPRSWRVELLPFLGQKALYDQYRKDEPWDSPANKKVLAQMPDVFRSPFDDPKSTNTAYFALVGPGTVFEGDKGISFKEIMLADGTSDTILFVEAKREIPWTKPEDISFDPDKPLPAVGGFDDGRFSAAFTDGHAARMKTEKIKDQLKWLIMRNDGHPVKWPKKVWE